MTKFGMRVGVHQIFVKVGFELMTSESYFRKMTSFFSDIIDSSNFEYSFVL